MYWLKQVIAWFSFRVPAAATAEEQLEQTLNDTLAKARAVVEAEVYETEEYVVRHYRLPYDWFLSRTIYK